MTARLQLRVAPELKFEYDAGQEKRDRIDELLEEGNTFEAGVVAGVEDSKDAGTREVRTREVPVALVMDVVADHATAAAATAP